jgi:hypothetical protein
MKIKCENVVACGNYKCTRNCGGSCIETVVALNADGKCVLFKPSESLEKPQTVTRTIVKDVEGNVIEESVSGLLI